MSQYVNLSLYRTCRSRTVKAGPDSTELLLEASLQDFSTLSVLKKVLNYISGCFSDILKSLNLTENKANIYIVVKITGPFISWNDFIESCGGNIMFKYVSRYCCFGVSHNTI